MEPLNHDLIYNSMSPHAQHLLTQLEILEEVDSTNLCLMRKANSVPVGCYACLSEQQSAGRGRQGRQWISPFACNIYLSVLWRFTGSSPATGLSLAIGVALVRALHVAGITKLGLKWPNDVLWRERKLAGILIEASPSHHIIGVGLNVAMPAQAGSVIEQPWVDVQEILGRPVSRNQLAGNLLEHLLLALQEFENDGLGVFLQEWASLDVLASKSVCLHLYKKTVTGIAEGIAHDGALRLSVDGDIRNYHDGEVSLLSTDVTQGTAV